MIPLHARIAHFFYWFLLDLIRFPFCRFCRFVTIMHICGPRLESVKERPNIFSFFYFYDIFLIWFKNFMHRISIPNNFHLRTRVALAFVQACILVCLVNRFNKINPN